MFKLITLNLFGLIISYCHAIPQQLDQLSLIANHNPHHLAFHQPELGMHHQLNFHQQAHHQMNPFQNQMPSPQQQQHFSRQPNQQNILRANRLMTSASAPKSAITRPQEQQMSRQFVQNSNQNNNQNNNQNSNFMPVSRAPQLRAPQSTNNQKRPSKHQQKSAQARSHSQHNHHHVQSKINWGRCKMLQPSIEEKMKKAQVISKCLEITPVPENITKETIELHRELVAACALQEEGWFTSALLSDENSSSKISVNNTNNDRMLLKTNLTTSSIDAINGTLKENDGPKNSLDSKKDDQIKEKRSSSSGNDNASESLLKPIHLNLNGTKVEQQQKLTNEKGDNSTSSKADKFDDQTTVLHESKHSALESDDYVEEDFSGYSAIFTGQLTYNYAKAEREIRAKHFDPDVEEKVIQFHESCKEEAQKKYSFPIQIIGQVQLYQGCMDYHISAVCGIEVTY